jgi:uncharacterized membrane protein YobD (UPF0266 family)
MILLTYTNMFLKNTNYILVIDTNRRRGIIESRLSDARRRGIKIFSKMGD